MSYIENPKTKGSGIFCAIPQTYKPCQNKCEDCFFSHGRSYLEPLVHNLPNIPPASVIKKYVIRVNDGLDSGQDIAQVICKTHDYPNKFYNTANPESVPILEKYGPVVLTINPGEMTDHDFYMPDGKLIRDLMFVRFRANMWNQDLLKQAVDKWCGWEVPIVITFMRYYNERSIQDSHAFYSKKAHILNPSWSVNQAGWEEICKPYRDSPLVSTCGANAKEHACRYCGVCLREYWRSQA